MKMIIAGGGTGGHLFPGIAIAKEFMGRDKLNSVLFVGSKRGIENRVLPKEGFPLHTLRIEGFSGLSMQTVKSLMLLPGAFLSSFLVIRKYKPDVILGIGGYSSGPLVLMGVWMKRLCFIQEQNIFPGKTNRFLGRRVKKVFTAFPHSDQYFAAKALCVGNPVRKEITSLGEKKQKGRFTVLVFGGSLGAHTINKAVTEALPKLADMRDKIHFIHQSGEKDAKWVIECYRGFSAEVVPFIDKMEDAYRDADMVICRAGATTLAELTHCKKPAVLIPYPFAAENHQEKNARSLTEAGAAFLLKNKRADGNVIAKFICHIFSHKTHADKMSTRIGKFAKDNSAEQIIDCILRTLDTKQKENKDFEKQ